MNNIESFIADSKITMIRIEVLDEAKACGKTVIASARLEGNGKYNIRSKRKVILRNLNDRETYIFITSVMQKYPNATATGLERPIYTKTPVSVSDIFTALNIRKGNLNE